MDLFKNFFTKDQWPPAPRSCRRVAPSEVLDLSQARGRGAARSRAWRYGDQCAPWCSPQAGMTPARSPRRSSRNCRRSRFQFTLPNRASSTPGCRRRRCRAWSATCCGEGDDFGRSDMGQGERVNVEYVSANPTGPLHVGHCRGAVFGDALAQSSRRSGLCRQQANITSTMPGAQVDVARALGLSALSRGAWRNHRRNSGRPLSRRLSETGRRRRWLEDYGRALLDAEKRNG